MDKEGKRIKRRRRLAPKIRRGIEVFLNSEEGRMLDSDIVKMGIILGLSGAERHLRGRAILSVNPEVDSHILEGCFAVVLYRGADAEILCDADYGSGDVEGFDGDIIRYFPADAKESESRWDWYIADEFEGSLTRLVCVGVPGYLLEIAYN